MAELTTTVPEVERPERSQHPHEQPETTGDPDTRTLVVAEDHPFSPPRWPPEQILALQRLVGNQAVAASMQKQQGDSHRVTARPPERRLAQSAASSPH